VLNILLFVSLVWASNCPPTKIVNHTSEWNDVDQKSLKSASERCVIKYPDSPCLKTFVKREEQVYWAICGA
jgi:hypothetical protein